MSLCSPDNPVIKMGKMAGGQLPKGFDLFWTDNFCYKNFQEFFFSFVDQFVHILDMFILLGFYYN